MFFVLIVGNTVLAMDPIPKQPGFSGFFRPAVGYMDVETNMVAEFLGSDLSKDRIGSLTQSPEGESSGLGLLAFRINYKFSNLNTQAFLGTELSDLVRFDIVQQLGIRHQIGAFGILLAGVLFSGISAEVWSDPYVVDRARSSTDRDSTGARLAWGEIPFHRLAIF